MKVACVQQRAEGIECHQGIFENLKNLIVEAAQNQADFIVLPECSYPAYFLGINQAECDKALEGAERFLEQIAELAAEHKVYIAAGAAVYEGEKLYNAAYMFDDNGKLVHKTAKSNMWHFDSEWFTPGEEFEVFDTKFGTMGMLVCADGRVPEIARILALKGAKVIIDLVNLTAAAAEPKGLMNQQYEFMLPVRAMENGTWFLVADKAGLEAGAASYLGRSMVIDPKGKIVADASPDKQEILYYEIDLDMYEDKRSGRRPDLYGEMVKETKELPVYELMKRPILDLSATEAYMSMATFSAKTQEEYFEKASHYIHACSYMGTRILCLPQADMEIEELAKKLQEVLPENLVLVISGMLGGYKSALILDKGQVYGKAYKTHGKDSNPEGDLTVTETTWGRVAVIFDEEAYIPEVPRSCMLKGCEVLIWSDNTARNMDTKVMQTRGAENKIFVIRTSNVEQDTASAVNPDGRPVTSTFRGMEQVASGMFFLPAARAKAVVPGTDVVLGRIGKAYKDLLK
ncbi:MAG: hypothetical protein HFJ10_02290 [Lachnospiraceae bacterium]|nr:hypothetical protein [Lachnospiraceae bacterium]